MRNVSKAVACAAACLWATTALMAQSGDGLMAPNRPSVNPISGEPINVRMANLKADHEVMQKDVRDLAMRMEELERQNAALRAQLQSSGANANANLVTRDELRLSEARTNDAIAAESKRVQQAILEEIRAAKRATRVEAPAIPPGPPSPRVTEPSKIEVTDAEKQSYMKEGIRYTVQPGDTLTKIAQKNNSSVRAIMVVNDISAPNKLWVGKELFVPTLGR